MLVRRGVKVKVKSDDAGNTKYFHGSEPSSGRKIPKQFRQKDLAGVGRSAGDDGVDNGSVNDFASDLRVDKVRNEGSLLLYQQQ